MAVYNNLPAGGGKWDLLWTNPNPTQNITADIIINVDLTQYAYIFAKLKASTVQPRERLVQCNIGDNWVATHIEGTEAWIAYRQIGFSNSRIQIGTSAGFEYHGTGDGTGQNYCIPTAFYGVKNLNLEV